MPPAPSFYKPLPNPTQPTNHPTNHPPTQGAVYGDVKPANFLFTSSPDAAQAAGDPPPLLKMVDVGCSQWCRPGRPLKSRTGTPVYLAPEVLLREWGPAADLWSVGMVAFHLSAGRLPFWSSLEGLTPKSVMQAILADPIDYGLLSGGPAQADLLRGLLDHSPACRPSAADALRHPWFVEMGV